MIPSAGWRMESLKLTGVAQLAEQRSPKPQVVGLSPTTRAEENFEIVMRVDSCSASK